MKKRVIITVLLVLAALSCTTWAAGEPELTESYDEVELFSGILFCVDLLIAGVLANLW